jgi:hypothetical protein
MNTDILLTLISTDSDTHQLFIIIFKRTAVALGQVLGETQRRSSWHRPLGPDMLPPHVHRAEHGDCGAALARGAATALPRLPRRGLGAGVGVVPDVSAGRHQSRVSLTTTSWTLYCARHLRSPCAFLACVRRCCRRQQAGTPTFERATSARGRAERSINTILSERICSIDFTLR